LFDRGREPFAPPDRSCRSGIHRFAHDLNGFLLNSHPLISSKQAGDFSEAGWQRRRATLRPQPRRSTDVLSCRSVGTDRFPSISAMPHLDPGRPSIYAKLSVDVATIRYWLTGDELDLLLER
jgi:hypothetical protein